MELCEHHYFDNTIFYRLIKKFMVQGGDPAGDGTGGESYFHECFEDEILPTLTHDRKGVLSMANKGPNTNTSQFFLTLDDCQYIDKKYTIFGRLVGGFATLDKIGQSLIDLNQKPIKEIKIISTIVYGNAYREVIRELLGKEKVKELTLREKAKVNEKERWQNPTIQNQSTNIGKYIPNKDTDRKV